MRWALGPPPWARAAARPRPAPAAAAVPSLPQVKVEELDEKWAGSLRLGLTTLAPGEMGPGAGGGPGLPPSLPELRTKTTWMVSSCEVRRDGQLQRMNYGRNLERLGVRQPAPGAWWKRERAWRGDVAELLCLSPLGPRWGAGWASVGAQMTRCTSWWMERTWGPQPPASPR